MSKDTIIKFKTPVVEWTDPLTDLPRAGAQQLIVNAGEAELLEFLTHRVVIANSRFIELDVRVCGDDID
jgi:hypothetical protein